MVIHHDHVPGPLSSSGRLAESVHIGYGEGDEKVEGLGEVHRRRQVFLAG